MKLQRVLVATGIIIFCSCGSQEIKESDEHSASHHEHMELDVKLNDGERWQANPETTTGINSMKHLVNKFKNATEVREYNRLSGELENEFTAIFKKCTMKGEAHNQLHNYLIPLKDYILGLQADNLKTCQTNYKELEAHLEVYPEYFN